MITTEDPGKWNVALTRRRTLLAGAALGGAALLTGCSEDPAPERDGHSSAAARLRRGAARDSTALLARYDATLAAHPTLEPALRPLRTEVARHAEAFGVSHPSSAGHPRPQVPKDERTARAQLADSERKLADKRTTALTTAPPELARLLASVAAAGAAHAYLLTKA
ncbi:hypothetical protein [Streptomyces chattanoogensis]|uniref:hypothetical protein n=1 Tax=Streptomyces chattanoogensis TaxID=66876 RepID=UPI001FE038CE|nr:hypothetical protein [Streptomyces chattanoogensis]